MLELAIVCWFTLQTGAMVCSEPMPLGEARYYAQHAQHGTTLGTVHRAGTPTYAEQIKNMEIPA